MKKQRLAAKMPQKETPSFPKASLEVYRKSKAKLWNLVTQAFNRVPRRGFSDRVAPQTGIPSLAS